MMTNEAIVRNEDPTPPVVYTVKDVSRILQCSTKTVLTDLQRGALAGFKIGGRGHWRIRAEDLAVYIQTALTSRASRVDGTAPDSP